jgi:hypothetical protein
MRADFEGNFRTNERANQRIDDGLETHTVKSAIFVLVEEFLLESDRITTGSSRQADSNPFLKSLDYRVGVSRIGLVSGGRPAHPSGRPEASAT